MQKRRISNPEDFGKVAVLMGGTAAEREVSLKSGMAVFKALQQSAVHVEAIDVLDSPVTAIQGKQIDRVFNVIHGRGGEDGVLQGVLTAMNLPYTGSDVLASALSMDKLLSKLCWQGYGLTTPQWFLLEHEQDIDSCVEKLGFPMIIKPAKEGSSLGMSCASTREELVIAWKIAAKYQCQVFAEAWVEGQEYTIGILQDEALPVIRLETPHVFYDYDAKYCAGSTQYHCPCGLTTAQEKQLQNLALESCAVLGVSGWARVDVFIDKFNVTQLIEANTVPGMTDHSLVPMAANAAGIDFNELVWRILETSVD
jgi:D-alanine-D-alanine ligase